MRILRLAIPALAFALACAAPAGDSTDAKDAPADVDADTDTDADSDADSDADTDVGCATVDEGDDWAWTGACPGMTTPVAITVDGCELALDYDSVGGMTMGMPYSGTVSGTEVTFANDNKVDDCVGTVETADKITGTCTGGCEFKLKR